MCFNFEVSIGTFAFSWTSALYLLKRKTLTKEQYQEIIFLMIFSTIQLLDAILWWNKMKRNNINFFVTSYMFPLVISLQIFYNIFVRNNGDNFYLNILGMSLIIYIFPRFRGYSKSICNNYFSSPLWAEKEFTYLELMVFLILSIYPRWKIILLVIVILHIIMFLFKGGYGSLWCAVSNLLAIYYLYKYW